MSRCSDDSFEVLSGSILHPLAQHLSRQGTEDHRRPHRPHSPKLHVVNRSRHGYELPFRYMASGMGPHSVENIRQAVAAEEIVLAGDLSFAPP
jgi:hypothetical protein